MDPREELAQLRRLEELERKAAMMPTSAAASAPPDTSFTRGLMGGLREGARGLGNVGLKVLSSASLPGRVANAQGQPLFTPGDVSSAVSDDAVRAEQKANEGTNTAGRVVGNIGAALPLAIATGGASVPSTATSMLGRTLAGPAGRVAFEGAVSGAAAADPNEQGKGALMGAAAGTAINKLGQAGGRLVRGAVQKSQAAQDLIHAAAQQGERMFLPISQAADQAGDFVTKAARTLYREALPLVPGVSGQFRNQQEKALEQVRQVAFREADPTGRVVGANAGREGLETRRALKSAFNKEYDDTVKSYAFNVPQNFDDMVRDRIRREMPNVDSQTLDRVSERIAQQMTRFSDGGRVIDGGNLLNAKNAANRLSGAMEGPERDALRHGTKLFDELIETELSMGGSPANLADLQRFKELAEPYKAFVDVGRAVSSAKKNKGNFTPAQLAQQARDPSPLLHLGTVANEVLGTAPSAPSTAGRVAAYSLGGMGIYGGGLPLVAGAVGGANALATRTAQNIFMGDTAAQQALARALRNNPRVAQILGKTTRAAGSTRAGDTDAE